MNKLVTKASLYLKRNSSTILTFMGGVGVGLTAVLAAQETPKAIQMLEKAKEKKGSDLTLVEKVVVATPCYAPAIATGTATIVCIFSANVLNQKRQGQLTSAYAMLDRYHKDYRNTLIELKGEEVDQEVRIAMARKRCDYHQIGLDTPDGKVVFYEEISGESIECYEREVMDAEYHFNRNFVLRGYASLNEFYRFLGLPETDEGEQLGWSMSDGYSWVDFEHRLVNPDDGGTPIYMIDFLFSPHSEYLLDWE